MSTMIVLMGSVLCSTWSAIWDELAHETGYVVEPDEGWQFPPAPKCTWWRRQAACPEGTKVRWSNESGTEAWCEDAQGMRSGRSTRWDAQLRRREDGGWRNGKRHGLWFSWDEQGGLEQAGVYSGGARVLGWNWCVSGQLEEASGWLFGVRMGGTWHRQANGSWTMDLYTSDELVTPGARRSDQPPDHPCELHLPEASRTLPAKRARKGTRHRELPINDSEE